MNQSPNNSGHRLRVRKKFLESSGKELAEYELLEILLFSAIPRQDTKALAKQLIIKFGDISGIINADIDCLRELDGVGEAVIVQIKIIAEILARILKKSAKKKAVLNNWEAVLDYANILLKDLNHEVFRVLFLDKKHYLIEDELVTIGENDHVFVNPRAIVKKALLLSASSIILLHNHPSGDVKASASDIKTTNEIKEATKNLNIKILDHLIISSVGYFSFREGGLL